METALPSFFLSFIIFFIFCQTHSTWFWKFPTGHGRVLQLDRFGSPTGSHYSQLFGPPHHAPPRPREEKNGNGYTKPRRYLVPLRSALLSAYGMLSERWQPMH